MTLTSAACPLTDVIEDQTRTALEGLVEDFRINWVWMPPGPDKITDDGREQLRASDSTSEDSRLIGWFLRYATRREQACTWNQFVKVPRRRHRHSRWAGALGGRGDGV